MKDKVVEECKTSIEAQSILNWCSRLKLKCTWVITGVGGPSRLHMKRGLIETYSAKHYTDVQVKALSYEEYKGLLSEMLKEIKSQEEEE